MALFLSLAGRGSASIRRMALYVHRERQIESIINATKRFRLRYCAVAVAILVAACLVALLCLEWIFGTHQHARIWVLVALFVFFGEPLGEILWRGKSRPERLEQSLRRTKVDPSAEGVCRSGTVSQKRLARNEIRRAEEISWGLYLRTTNRYRWILIPARIDGFESLKREIAELGIPIVQSGIPPNWEELFGVSRSPEQCSARSLRRAPRYWWPIF